MQLKIDFEIWKDVQGYEGIFQISNHGRVKSLFKKIYRKGVETNQSYPERIVPDINNGNGYRYITFCVNGIRKNNYVHRLVAKHFLLYVFNKKEVNHKDGVKSNNHVSNLEWVTPDENKRHASINKLLSNGRYHQFSRLVLNVNTGKIYDNAKSLSEDLNINYGTLKDGLRKSELKNKTFRGFKYISNSTLPNPSTKHYT